MNRLLNLIIVIFIFIIVVGFISNMITVNRITEIHKICDNLKTTQEIMWQNVDSLTEGYTTIWVEKYGEDSWYETLEDKEYVRSQMLKKGE